MRCLHKALLIGPNRCLQPLMLALQRLTAMSVRWSGVHALLPRPQVDRNEDMLRSCLRAVEAISRIPGVNACEPWRNFMQVHSYAFGLL